MTTTKVINNSTAKASLVSNIQLAFLGELGAGYNVQHIAVTLSRGSVKASVTITPLASSTNEAAVLRASVLAKKANLNSAVTTQVKAMPEVSNLLEAGRSLTELTVTSTNPVQVVIYVTTTTTPMITARFGFNVNDKVSWMREDPSFVPAGSIGTVVGFTLERVRVAFAKGTWTFNPEELVKEAFDAVSEGSRRAVCFPVFMVIPLSCIWKVLML